MKTIGIIQARTSSSRLSGKVLREVLDKPVIKHIYERVKRSLKLDSVIVATSVDQTDDILVSYLKDEGIPFFRGSLNNVLERFYLCAKEEEAERIVRFTGDNLCVDPLIIDRAIDIFNGSRLNYLYYAQELPNGMGVEVCDYKSLKRAYNEASDQISKEHVMPYLYKNGNVFNWVRYSDELLENNSKLRVTLDTVEDLEVINNIFEYFGNNYFEYDELLTAFKKNPEWKAINRNVVHIRI